MVINFDSFGNPLPLTMNLAKKSGDNIGVIIGRNVVFKRRFNSYSEVSFCVDQNDNNWDNVVDFKLLHIKENDLWFEINVNINEENSLVKNVTAKSLAEAELSQIKLYNFEANTETDISRDDYVPTVFYDTLNTSSSLLHRMMSKVPHYEVLYVSPSLQGLQRTFSFNETNLYDALQTVSKELNCFIDFSVHSDSNGKPLRQISVYDLESYCPECGYRGDFSDVCPECNNTDIIKGYGEDSRIFVCTDNLSDSIDYITNIDKVKNCFKLEAGDDLMTAAIVNCNPNGSSYLWYISEEMKADMPSELVAKLEDYNELYEMYQNTSTYSLPSTNRTTYNTLVDLYENYHTLNSIPSSIVGFSGLMGVYYDTVDFKLLLESSLMPTAETAGTTAAEQVSRLTTVRLSPLAVYSLTSASASTIENSALLLARSIVNYDYQVKVASSTYNSSTHIWQGTFRVTNYYNDDDTAITSTISITVTDNYEDYVAQIASKAIASSSKTETDIVGLFEMNNTDFAAALKKYSLNRLKSFEAACEACFNVLIEHGAGTDIWNSNNDDLYDDLYVPYRNKQTLIQQEIQVRESEIQTVQTVQDKISERMSYIKNQLNFENYLGSTLWKIFSSYRREDTYSNSNYISDGLDNTEILRNAQRFLEIAKKDIFKSATLQHSITSDLKDLLAMREFDGLTSFFEVGNWIHIRVNDRIYNLRLLEYEVDFESLNSVNVTFSDVEYVLGGLSDNESIFNQTRAMVSSYDNVSRQAEQGNSSRKQLDGWAERGLALTSLKILNNADSQDYVFDEHGMLFRKYRPITNDYDAKQLKIINSTIAMTSNNWTSVKTAIGEIYYIDPLDSSLKNGYGINGEVIIGKLILGEQLGIYNSGATLRFNKDGLYISNDTVTFIANPNNLTKLFAITVGSSDVLSVSATGSLTITGTMYATGGEIGGCSISNGVLQIDAAKITSGTIDTARIPNLSANKITTGTMSANRISGGTIDATNVTITNLTVAAAQITSGTIDSARIPNLSASKITSGQLSASRINGDGLVVTNGTFSGGISGELKDGIKLGTNSTCTISVYNSGHGNTGCTIAYDENTYIRMGQQSQGDELWIYSGRYVTIGGNTSNSKSVYIKSEYVRIGNQNAGGTGSDSNQTDGRLYGNWYLNGGTTAVTSDRNLKNTITPIGNKYDQFFDEIRPVTFKYNNGTSNRLHTGFIAQEIDSALVNAELTTLDFGGYVVTQENEVETRYLRYEEFVALNTWQIQKLKARVAELERIVAGLQNT